MAEISFYLSDQERTKLFDFVSDNFGKLIPNTRFKKAEYYEIKDSKDFLNHIQNITVGYFIISQSFSNQKLLIEKNEISKEDYYLIMQRYGGPYVNLSLYRGFADDAKVKYKRTDIHHYPQYINIENNYEEFKASEELKDYFKGIIKFLKSISKNVSIDGKKYWIGKEALAEMEEKK